jgi:hypothetical protein
MGVTSSLLLTWTVNPCNRHNYLHHSVLSLGTDAGQRLSASEDRDKAQARSIQQHVEKLELDPVGEEEGLEGSKGQDEWQDEWGEKVGWCWGNL